MAKKKPSLARCRNVIAAKRRAAKDEKLEPFNTADMKRLPESPYCGTVFDYTDGCLFIGLSGLNDKEHKKLEAVFVGKVAGNDITWREQPLEFQNLIAVLDLAQGWQTNLIAQHRDFQKAVWELQADYEVNSFDYTEDIDLGMKLDEDAFDTDITPEAEIGWWLAIPVKESNRLANGCLWVANGHSLDDRWTDAEKNLIAVEMRYCQILAPASERLCNLLSEAVARYRTAIEVKPE